MLCKIKRVIVNTEIQARMAAAKMDFMIDFYYYRSLYANIDVHKHLYLSRPEVVYQSLH